jgi:hypothetical protein
MVPARRCYTSVTTIALLHEKFDGLLISIRGDQQWPPRSYNLAPCDFFLWGFIKSLVYVNKLRSLLDLKQEIQRVINELDGQVCENVICNFMNKVTACRASREGQMHDIVFHT